MSISTLWSKTKHNAFGYFPVSSTTLFPLACGASYKGPGANEVQETFNLDNSQSIQHILSINHASVIELEMSTAGCRANCISAYAGNGNLLIFFWADGWNWRCSAGGWEFLCQVLIGVWLCGWSENVTFWAWFNGLLLDIRSNRWFTINGKITFSSLKSR